MSDRQLFLWDARSLDKPISTLSGSYSLTHYMLLTCVLMLLQSPSTLTRATAW